MSISSKDLNKFYLRKNLTLAWPLAINGLLMQSMLIIDTLLIAPLGEFPLAAIGIAGTIIAFFLGLQFALSNGTQLIVGRIIGSNNNTALVQVIKQGLSINLFSAIVFILLLSFSQEQLISLLTDDALLANEVQAYLSIAKYILLVNAITQTITALLNGQGNTKTPLISYLFELPFNAVISYVLIFGLDFSDTIISFLSISGIGLSGAAYGSLAAITIRLTYFILYLKLNFRGSKNNTNFYRNLQGIKAHFCEISPIAANYLVLSIGNTIYLLLFSQLNIYSYAAITLVFPWIRIATQFIVAWAQANTISITHAIGKQQLSHIKPIISTCLTLGGVMACIVASLLYVFSLNVELIYPNVGPQTYLALASITPLYVILPLVRTYNTIAGNILRAQGNSLPVLKIHFFTQWLVVLPLCALFVLHFKLPLFWAFALIPLEEIIKAFPFYYLMNKNS